MKTKLMAACLGLAALAACGGGGSKLADRSPGATSGANAPSIDATPPADVKAAAEGEANRPREGSYVYSLTSSSKNASTPDAPTRTSSPGAEWVSNVSYDGDVVVTKDKTTEGSAVSTVRREWTKDGVRELSFETKTSNGTGGCTFDESVVVLRFPIKEGKLPMQNFKGTGTNCDGERTITIEGREDVRDGEGRVWPAWRIEVDTVVKSVGLTNNQKDTRWFSPDLGKDIKIKGSGRYINPSGVVAAQATNEIVLKSYPRA